MARPPKNQINTYDEELAQFAVAVAAEKAQAAGSTNNVSLKAGLINVGGSNRGNAVPVIVLSDVALNTYYRGTYDPSNPEGPVCFAFTPEAEGTPMCPHSQSAQAQSNTCEGCPHNQFGSAIRPDGSKGAGKACKNTQRLVAIIGEYQNGKVVMPADLDSAPLWQIGLPPTSVRNWAGFCVGTAQLLKRPPFGVIARMSTSPDAKSQFRVEFAVERNVTAEEYAQIKPRLEEAKQVARTPFATVLREQPAAGKQPAGKTKRKYT